ncbi:hypothetical protein ELQ35_02250 [Peribacillus cavernae]|uniref:Uncharacterized protein n=1 Tax=Peribacillus cavernae TaxID=1674310 RepID=A0A3S0U7Y9_9BACI|nr:hypothetical protein [Peribacillus cavernae]MDQ0219971.1 hypothetical protein [Peribacillus cavernae]RUQ32036.1 hypothetical protein ELQ35_02250 [Peribacillus cavernae]
MFILLKSVESIDEIFESIKGAPINKKLFISQSEAYPTGFALGDEDSSGTSLKMKVVLLLESDASSLYYKQEFQDEEQYKEIVSKIDQLKNIVPYENINEDEMMKKRKGYEYL